ncbi:malignant fibrous histiocytoma-amplified sequence 1-like [Lingula anatina]|uniref:Malignant fibrous histiocytoma-amplified sequence 1-like n=1 Tax=Lingula anatina TaxID=7574 RepID=A0A1S3J1Y4_LINAN|nr:malignant fibrous histiocytoma-amplified sequence 1-like [Lingula anatina]|eukprot:XP_013404435.1 malignant fibrous histiocytoma-amplified sequence 1-like [Lingula anatina]
MDQKQVKAGKESLLILEKLQDTCPSRTPVSVLEWTLIDYDNADIEVIPESIKWCFNVRKIYGQRNKLSSLPQSISDLQFLKELWLGNNQFEDFPSSVCDVTLLELLDLSGNQLLKIPRDINRLRNLRSLYLSNNKFTDFPTAVCGIRKLEELQLDNNQLSQIPDSVQQMDNLHILELGNNDFNAIPDHICSIPNLEKLFMENNAITHIPPSIGNLQKLNKLKLDQNKITHLPHALVSAKNLLDIHLHDNPLVEPPESVCSKGLEAIGRYFHELKDSKAVQSSRIQLNLLGETGSGKTSVSLSLQRDKPTLTAQADRTRVIAQGSCETQPDIAFNINDFGGHDVYKVSHPIFISKNGIVLIAFNLVTYNLSNPDHYGLYIGDWIDKVQAQTPGMRIALLGTHFDEVSTEAAMTIRQAVLKQMKQHMEKKKRWLKTQVSNIDEKIEDLQQSPEQEEIIQAYRVKQGRLSKAANHVVDVCDHVFMVSSKTMEGYPQLKEYLSNQAQRWAVSLPGTWVQAANAIRIQKYENSNNTLDWVALQEVISQHAPRSWQKRSPTEKRVVICDILSFLASRGDIIWFDTSPTLARVIFHKQEILAGLLKAVLNHDLEHLMVKLLRPLKISRPRLEDIREDFAVRGIVSKDVMKCLWGQFHLSSVETEVLVELLQQLELCYQVEKGTAVTPDTTFHFPWLLTEDRQQELEEKWPRCLPQDLIQVTLEVYFPYKCPDGMFEKFSVRQHNYLGFYKSHRMDWKDGLYAQVRGCRIQISRSQRESDWVITVAIRGRNIEDLWPPLHRAHSDLMSVIQEDWPGVSYDKFLVCPHCVKEGFNRPHLFPGELLDRPPPISGEDADVPCRNCDDLIDAGLVHPATKAEICHKGKNIGNRGRLFVTSTVGHFPHGHFLMYKIL